MTQTKYLTNGVGFFVGRGFGGKIGAAVIGAGVVGLGVTT